MHDPLVVAFTIRRPWPKRRHNPARSRWWPPLITVWHREPSGRDAGTVCGWRTHWRHPHHWHLQVHPTQTLKRWLWSRCAWCGGRFRWGTAPCSLDWNGPGPRWFRGEPMVLHGECDTERSKTKKPVP